MSDTTQGQDVNDNDLFNNAVNAETLDKFENPELPLDLPDQPKPDPKPAPKPEPEPLAAKSEAREEDNAQVPAYRLREAAEARRQAERERDELRAQIARAQPPQPEKPAVDIFDNPTEFVQQQFKPYLERMAAERELERETQSRNSAIRHYGNDKVHAAYKALEEGIGNRDPYAVYAYQQARGSYDPYDTIMQWHQQVETLKAVGTDPKAYRARTEEELLADPEFLRKASERARSAALSNGNSIARPVRQTPSSSPSLGDVGAGGGDTQVIEPSDEQLFRAATSAKRR